MRFYTTVYDTALIVLIGLPASGKSHYAKEMVRDNPMRAQWISSDNIRIEHDYNISNEKVFQKMWERTKAAALGKKYIIYDATNLSSRRRELLVKQFKHFCQKNNLSCIVEARVFLQPVEVLLERNKRRTGRECVPEEVIYRMLSQFQFPYYFEGYVNIEIDKDSTGIDLDLGTIAGMDQQNPHHTYTLGGHMLKAYDWAIINNYEAPTKIAAAYHDVGKYYTKNIDDKGIAHYYGHENYGAYIVALHFLANELLNIDDYYKAVILINHHMRPFAWKKSSKIEEKDKKRFGAWLHHNIYRLNECDAYAH